MIISDEGIIRSFPLIRTSFCISGEEFDPDYITKQIHSSPTMAWRKGDIRRDWGENSYYEKHPNISCGKYTYSCWWYSTEYKQAYDIMESASLILEEFVPLIDKLLYLKAQYSLSYQICIAIKREKKEEQIVFPGMILSRNLIEFVNIIGAEISLDFDGMIF